MTPRTISILCLTLGVPFSGYWWFGTQVSRGYFPDDPHTWQRIVLWLLVLVFTYLVGVAFSGKYKVWKRASSKAE